MKDIRVVSAKVALPVSSVSDIRDFLPPSVIVLGDKLSLAQEVTYNGITVDEFIISSPNRLVVKIPQSQYRRPLTELTVLTSVPLAQQDALLSFGIQRPLKTVSGIDRLVQEWSLVFLTTPGSDIFDQESGGGGLSLVGKNTRSSDEVTADLTVAVERTKSQIVKMQSKNLRIPPSERLLSSVLSDVKYNSITTVLSAVVTLKNMVGTTASVTVG